MCITSASELRSSRFRIVPKTFAKVQPFGWIYTFTMKQIMCHTPESAECALLLCGWKWDRERSAEYMFHFRIVTVRSVFTFSWCTQRILFPFFGSVEHNLRWRFIHYLASKYFVFNSMEWSMQSSISLSPNSCACVRVCERLFFPPPASLTHNSIPFLFHRNARRNSIHPLPVNQKLN